ncbi:MAG: hypothetical protein PHQ05_02375 [Sterolibacterium sp.]|nr:hypothetical protein [Sterolibacterium sp.]
MPRKRPSHPGYSEAVRRDISNVAARLMAEDGISSYGLAKRKAAKQLGIPDSEALPANQEIEEALRVYLSLYQEEELPERLKLLRQEALVMMRLLEKFSPYLVGPALDGTAVRYAEAEIELFADSAKDVEIFLLDQGISFEHADIRRNILPHVSDQMEARFRVDGNDTILLLSIYPHTLERMRRRNPHTGHVAGRANIDTVAALLEQT